MIQHIVLLKWKPDTTEEQIRDAFEHVRRLVDEVPGVSAMTLGRHRGDASHGFTHAIIVKLDSEDALRGYLEHPARVAYVEEWLRPLEDQRIEIDVPVDLVARRTPRRDWEWGASIGMGMRLPD